MRLRALGLDGEPSWLSCVAFVAESLVAKLGAFVARLRAFVAMR